MLLTGHAAGVAAGLAVARDVAPRNVPIAELQDLLRRQGAYLQTAPAAADRRVA